MSYLLKKKSIAVDFDGVLSNYASGWQGIDNIPDNPVPGAIEWLNSMVERYEVHIYSCRSESTEGRGAMYAWLYRHGALVDHLNFPETKPNAHLYIDDRAYTFTGTNFPDNSYIDSFKPWNKK